MGFYLRCMAVKALCTNQLPLMRATRPQGRRRNRSHGRIRLGALKPELTCLLIFVWFPLSGQFFVSSPKLIAFFSSFGQVSERYDGISKRRPVGALHGFELAQRARLGRAVEQGFSYTS